MSASDPESPNYDVVIDADELLEDLAERAAKRARKHSHHRECRRETLDPHPQYRRWELEEHAAMRAYGYVIEFLQPEGRFNGGAHRNDDGTVDVRGLIRGLQKESAAANEDRSGTGTQAAMAAERHHAISRVISLLRNEYGVGWPRLDDLGGTPLECDMP